MNIFADALDRRATAIPYTVLEALTRMHPKLAILQSRGSFELEKFADAGGCEATRRSEPYPIVVTEWSKREPRLSEETTNGWFDVRWEGHILQTVMLSYDTQMGCRSRNFVLADAPAIARSFFDAVQTYAAKLRGEVWLFDDGHWGKSERLYGSIESASFDDLVLAADLKSQIIDDFERFLGAESTYDTYGVPYRRGILFVGPPGNGKTHCVRALVRHLGFPCLYVRSLASKYWTPHTTIRRVFEHARDQAPCILILEDLETLLDQGKNRSVFLNELDGFAQNRGIVTLATTNNPAQLDPAILERPSRFDMKYHFDLPSETERRDYACLWNEKLAPPMKVEEHTIDHIVTNTEGFSFAYLKELFVSSISSWMRTQRAGTMPEILSDELTTLRRQMSEDDDAETCSFCGRSSSEVEKLIEGDEARICDACIEGCNSVIEAEREREAPDE